MEDTKLIQVRVALRCRPLGRKEVEEGATNILSFTPNRPQVSLQNKNFTYDYAFSPNSTQDQVYGTAVEGLIDNLFSGYNVTVLAYGQTGSGKTYTMGTNGDLQGDRSSMGIIPRIVEDIFCKIAAVEDAEFLVKVSFIEIHKEELFDLLVRTRESLNIREDSKSGIHIPGLTEHPVTCLEDTMEQLELGTRSRSTAATNMNLHSSRSHAIFTLTLERRSNNDPNDQVKAKLHLVDLAGSERAKRTGAQGERLKEGIQINRGLLSLGNVISALCDDNAHVPYRDSKLTRMLQDSLGGNSHTIMIACVSPADTNLDETLNTLRYADRARKIKNKPVVNRDPFMAEVMGLREKVRELEGQLSGNQVLSGLENLTLSKPYSQLLNENNKLKEENRKLAWKLYSAASQTSKHCEKALSKKLTPNDLTKDLEELIDDTETTINDLNESINPDENPELHQKAQDILQCQNLLKTIQARKSLKELEFSMFSPKPKKTVSRLTASNPNSPAVDEDDFEKESEIVQADLHRQLSELDQDLKMKEKFIASLQENVTNVTVIEYQNTIGNLETEITHLTKEKDELIEQLRAAKSSANASKVSEMRRKRLQELEAQINSMKEELTKKNKLLRIKEDCDRKAKMYQQEIQDMKQARVKLMKRMKEEADKHRQWQNEKNREMNKLKQQEKKRQYQLVKMERDFTKEKRVLQRKLEEANAACKRLQMVKEKQQRIAQEKAKMSKQLVDEGKAKVLLSQELEMETSKLEAEFHLNNLITDRKLLSEKIATYKFTLEANQNKENFDPAEAERIKNLIEQSNQELALRARQISNIKKDIDEINQENKPSNRWENIHTLSEAKIFMKLMMDELVSSKSELLKSRDQLQDDTNTMEEMKKKHLEDMASLVHKHKENMAEIKRLEKELQDKTVECEDLKGQAKNNCSRLQRSIFPPTPLGTKTLRQDNALDETFELPKKKPTKMAATKTTALPGSRSPNLTDEETLFSDDDVEKDPDWQKTPLKASILMRKPKESMVPRKLLNKESIPKKCRCQTSCSNRKCGCYHSKQACLPSCRCNKEKCRNNQEFQDGHHDDTSTQDSVIQNRSDSSSVSHKTLSHVEE